MFSFFVLRGGYLSSLPPSFRSSSVCLFVLRSFPSCSPRGCSSRPRGALGQLQQQQQQQQPASFGESPPLRRTFTHVVEPPLLLLLTLPLPI